MSCNRFMDEYNATLKKLIILLTKLDETNLIVQKKSYSCGPKGVRTRDLYRML